jgi:hypothetical protein
MFPFQVKKLAELPLRPDLSNLSEIRLPALKEALVGSDRGNIFNKLLESMVAEARKGFGIAEELIPNPLMQEELECQTLALINGIYAVTNDGKMAKSLFDQIPRIRAAADKISEDGGDKIVAVAQCLFEQKVLQPLSPQINPIATTIRLFSQRCFYGVAMDEHAFCCIPLARATLDRFVVKLDSRYGKEILSAREFAEIALAAGWDNNQNIYQVLL